MNINIDNDIFIAFHDSSGSDGALKQAEAIYNFLTENGIKCFLFPESSSTTAYKANFITIMQSRLLLMVCNDKLSRKNNGEIDYKKNYHLYVELDSFYAMTQSDEVYKSINDSAVLFFKNSDSAKIEPSPETLHPLFNNRNSFFIADSADDEDTFDKVLEWVNERLDYYDNNDISNEIVGVLTGRVSDILNRRIEGINFQRATRKATCIKCIGISNWTFSLTDGCKKLIQGLKRGTSFEMIFLKPDGEFAKLRAAEEKKDTTAQIRDSFDMIRAQLSNHFKNTPEVLTKLSTYTYDMIPRDNLIFIYSENEDYLLVQSYSHALPGSVCPCIILRRRHGSESPLFEYYESIYENVKNDSNTRQFEMIGGAENE